ncbi:hypothetical protein [Nocardia nova]|uniref:hypothetical protein n=1 Tax=Nocardia nova TaxID=37330 RepID=UPI00340181B5
MLVAIMACAGATTIASPAVQAAPTCGGTPSDWQGTGGNGVTYSGISHGARDPFERDVTINLNAGIATMTADPSAPIFDKLKQGTITFHPDGEISVQWTAFEEGEGSKALSQLMLATMSDPECSSDSSAVTSAKLVATTLSHDQFYQADMQRTAG